MPSRTGTWLNPMAATMRMPPPHDGRIDGGDVEHEEDVDDQHQAVGPEHAAHAAAAPAAQHRAAEDDGGEHLQEQRLAQQGVAGRSLRGDDDPGEAVERARHDVGEELRPRHAEAGILCCLRIAAHCIERGPEPAVLDQEPRDDDAGEEHDRSGQPVLDQAADEEVGEPGRKVSAGRRQPPERARPLIVNIVASVTTMDCRRCTATK